MPLGDLHYKLMNARPGVSCAMLSSLGPCEHDTSVPAENVRITLVDTSGSGGVPNNLGPAFTRFSWGASLRTRQWIFPTRMLIRLLRLSNYEIKSRAE